MEASPENVGGVNRELVRLDIPDVLNAPHCDPSVKKESGEDGVADDEVGDLSDLKITRSFTTLIQVKEEWVEEVVPEKADDATSEAEDDPVRIDQPTEKDISDVTSDPSKECVALEMYDSSLLGIDAEPSRVDHRMSLPLGITQVPTLALSKLRSPLDVDSEPSTYDHPKTLSLGITYVPTLTLSKSLAILYSCDMCTFTCDYKTHLIKHIRRTHSGDKIYRCYLCVYKSSKASDLKDHMVIHTGNVFSCDLCDFLAFKSARLKQHMKTHSKDEAFESESCGYKRCIASDLKGHKKYHIEEIPSGCSYRTTRSANLKRHKRTQDEDMPFACAVCDYNCSTAGDLKIHNQEAHKSENIGKRPPKEDIGIPPNTESGSFSVTGDVETDCHTSSSEKVPKKRKTSWTQKHPRKLYLKNIGKLVARYGADFSYKKCLKNDGRFHCPDEDCKNKDRGYGNQKLLRNHIKMKHIDVDCPKCGKCGKSFATASILKEHQMVHSDVLAHSCAKCGKAFKSAGILKQHAGTHGGMWLCYHCTKSFSSKKTLVNHFKEMPYRCNTCDVTLWCRKMFTTHEEEVGHDYCCPLCPKKYSTWKTFSHHVHVVHYDKTIGVHGNWHCLPCDRKFTNWRNTYRHMRRIHKIVAPTVSLMTSCDIVRKI